MELQGYRQLQAKLDKLGYDAGRQMAPALVKAAGVVRDKAKALAPVDTGAMRDGIHVTKPKVRLRAASVRVQTGRREQMGIPKGANYYYPAAVEYGTKHRAAQPFMRPAALASRKQVVAILSDELGRRIEEDAAA